MAHEEFKHPPLSPGNDELSFDDERFLQRCHAHASRTILNLKLEMTQEAVTRSKDWGLVWRADFRFPNRKLSSPTTVDRFMCWEKGETLFFMSSVALHEPPLSATPKKYR
jgi:hypothetical protein